MAELQREIFEVKRFPAEPRFASRWDKTQNFTECCVTYKKVTADETGAAILLIL